jgi:ribonuclease P protein component
MLPRGYRLTQERDFRRVNSRGQSFFSTEFRLRKLANLTEKSRFAVVVSTKVSKKATQRNTLKRQIKEILRLNLDKIKPGYDITISVNSKALNLDFDQLNQGLKKLLIKANLV